MGNYFKNIPARFKNFFGNSGRETYASMCLMGTGQMLNGQYVKGLLYLLAKWHLWRISPCVVSGT